MRIAKFRKGVFSPAEDSANYTLEFFRIPQNSNNQLCMGLGLHISLELTSAPHKWHGHAVGKVITSHIDVFNLILKTP